MLRYIMAVAALAAAVLPSASFAERDATNSAKQELVARSELPGQSFRDYLKLFQPRKVVEPINVSYSKAWLDQQPKATGDENWKCLSEALYFEARGESVRGQFAVAEVILNRVKSSRFPGSLCGVIRQGTGKKYQCQFTYTCDGHKEVIHEKKAFERVSKVARAAIDGIAKDLTEGATHYHTTAVRPSWSRVYKQTARIGVHIFYRHNYRTASN
ncbi:cell wall hydrolase [Rhodobacteraceae bacterium B1Z28]|uniref:Cell wall hydrolase n=1 Tax=Ruegeria haliotis TaxID=2747601 RepID=A0ABX2PNN2_9RHOB|nr:cell wall hydrolase [Ruegeria haliotis]NVO54857.1 cell wall hydrolase [Ruegeria haliotis]